MLCQRCKKNEAFAKYEYIANNIKHEVSLCTNCVMDLGIKYIASEFDINDMISGMLNTHNTVSDITRCEMCGASFRDFVQSGKAGCAKCYKTFYSQLLPSLQKIHGKVTHTGKIPASAGNDIRRQREVENLKISLSRAIETQEFEKAAEIRDRLKDLANDI